jgi:hypothetical protein
MLPKVRERLTYANVMATGAVFIALGGTSYALTLPRNSVGSSELRKNSVGRSELRSSAVSSSEVRNRSLRLRDLAPRTRESLRGPVGPAGPQGRPGVALFAAVDSVGRIIRGNADSSHADGIGGRQIGFPRPLDTCVASATLATAPNDPDVPPAAHVSIARVSGRSVLVRTWNADGQAAHLPFNLVVAC